MSSEPEYPEDYYEHLAHTLGEEQAAWARLPRAEREAELTWIHASLNTPDDLAIWPPELNGGLENAPGSPGAAGTRRSSAARHDGDPPRPGGHAMADDPDETSLLLDCKDAESRRQLLAELFMKHRPRLRSMVEIRMDRRAQGRFDPSDVVQEAYLEASQRLGEYLRDPPMPLYIWLRRLTAQKLLGLYRHHFGAQARDVRKEVSLDGDELLETSSAAMATCIVGRGKSPSEEAERAEAGRTVEAALEGLEPLDREVLALRHFEKLSNVEIARLLDIRESAASKRYYRALWRLEKALGGKPLGGEGR